MSNTISLEGGWTLKLKEDYVQESLRNLMNSVIPDADFGYSGLNELYDLRDIEERELIGGILQELMSNGRNFG